MIRHQEELPVELVLLCLKVPVIPNTSPRNTAVLQGNEGRSTKSSCWYTWTTTSCSAATVMAIVETNSCFSVSPNVNTRY